jgi:CheY-like chemotaxis protein
MNTEKKYQGTVLKVDDMPSPCKFLEKFLLDKGLKIKIASDGKEAIQIAEQIQPDVILMDLFMPEMDGFEAYQVLKSQKNTQHIPVIFMFAMGEYLPKEILDLEYVTKPLKHEEVWALVKTHLNQ